MKLIAIILFLFACSPINAQKGNSHADAKHPLYFGDPFVMLHGDTYYAYGTSSPDGIEVYVSDDLKTWKKQDKLALHKNDSWGDKWFWAPEVYYIPEKKKFFMYYSADEHICVATSDQPAGPFRQEEKQPMLPGEKSIDNTMFQDKDNGKAYLYFDRFNDGLNIWVAELEPDLKSIKKETLKPCIHVSQKWEEVWPRVNEGPFVMKHNNKYLMTYSANSYESPFYGIGLAMADSPTGPWTKYENNPILQKPGDLAGIGHNAFFTDKNGKLRTTFHAHHSKDQIHPRIMYIADAYFTDGEAPILRIDAASIFQPQVEP